MIHTREIGDRAPRGEIWLIIISCIVAFWGLALVNPTPVSAQTPGAAAWIASGDNPCVNDSGSTCTATLEWTTNVNACVVLRETGQLVSCSGPTASPVYYTANYIRAEGGYNFDVYEVNGSWSPIGLRLATINLQKLEAFCYWDGNPNSQHISADHNSYRNITRGTNSDANISGINCYDPWDGWRALSKRYPQAPETVAVGPVDYYCQVGLYCSEPHKYYRGARCDSASGRSSQSFCTVTVNPPPPPPPPQPSCSSAAPQAAVTTDTSGTFYAYIYGVSDATAVNVAVWGEPGWQDDLVWYLSSAGQVVNMGGGTWRVAINLANHKVGNPEYGTFFVHAYMNNASYTNTPCTPTTMSGQANFVRTLPAPTGLTASCNAALGITASWNNVPNATYYAFRADNTTAGGWNGTCNPSTGTGDICENVAGTSRSWTGAYSNSYNVWVHACNASVCSANPTTSFTCPVQMHTLTINGNGGTMGGTPAGSYAQGAAINISQTPPTGYTFNGWTSTNSVCAGTGNCSFSMPAYGVTVNANYTLNTYTVNATAGAGGTIAPASRTVTHGNSTSFTVTANTGYTVSSVTYSGGGTGSGCSAGQAGCTYSLSNVTSGGTVTATFAPNTYAVTYNANSATSGSVPGAQTKTHDVNLTLQTNSGNLARAGYTFTGWNTQANGLGTDYAVGGTYTANAATTLYAKWTPAIPAVTLTPQTTLGGTTGSAFYGEYNAAWGGVVTNVSWSATNNPTSCVVYRNGVAVSGVLAYPGTAQYNIPWNEAITAATTYRVDCTNPGGTGQSNTVTFTVPAPPTNPTQTCGPAGTTVSLGWTAPGGSAGNYLRGHQNPPAWTGTCTGGELCVTDGANPYSWSITPGTTYSWWVHSRVANGNWSNYVSGANFSCTPVSYALTVTKNGAGNGTVTGTSAPVQPNINCGATCALSYSYGTLVQLSASPAGGSTFTGWSGEGCSGTGTCTVTMSQARNVTATFGINQHTLTITNNRTSASVTTNPNGSVVMNCGTTCSSVYDYGTSVTVNAPAQAGYSVAISGGCSASGGVGSGASCTLSMTANQAVTVTYTAQPDLYSTNSSPSANAAFRDDGSITFTGSAVNTGANSVAQGGWADVEIDWDSDGSFSNFNAFGGVQLGSFTPGQSKALSYTYNNPPVGTHRYRFNVDTTNALSESDESNNRSAWVSFRVPDVTLTANPTSVNWQGTSTISWTFQGTSNSGCTVAGGTDSWNISSVSSPRVTSPLGADTLYTLSCDGGPALAQVTVDVDSTPELWITEGTERKKGATVQRGNSATLNWNTKEQNCTLTSVGRIGNQAWVEGDTPPGNPANRGFEGSRQIPIGAHTTYTLDCGAGGEASVTIEIISSTTDT